MIKDNATNFIKKNIANLKKDAKTKTVIVNVIYSVFIKVVIVGVSFLSVPLLLGYLDSGQYGVWLTILTFTSWFTLFDLGLGNGLKNKLIEFLTKDDMTLARKHVSTTYIAMGTICLGLCFIVVLGSSFIPWDKIFNISGSLREPVAKTTIIVLIFTLVSMILRLINNLLHAYQQSYKVDIINFASQLTAFFALCLAKYLFKSSLVTVALVFTLSQFVVLLVVNIYFFSSLFKNLIPSFKSFDSKLINDVVNISGQFFFIQVAGIVMYMTDNFIIANLIGPDSVTTYNISLKYFSILPMVWGLVLTPLWPMVTKSYYSGDLKWLKKTLSNLTLLWVVSILLGMAILLFANTFYHLWIGTTVIIPQSLNLCILVYTCVSIFATIMATFINGIGKIKMQAYITVVVAILNVPLAIIFSRVLNWGLVGVPLATAVCLSISSLFAFIQSRKIINSTAAGVWNS